MSPLRFAPSVAVLWLSFTAPRPAMALQSDSITFRSVSAGATHTCALTTGGEAYCWGDNQEGELGTGSRVDATVPTAVIGGIRFLTIDAAVEFTCGLATTGEAYCWGRNDSHTLGNAAMRRSLAPVLVSGGLLFRAVAAGADHVCGLAVDGAAFCWGANDAGQLGTGDTLPSPLPLPVAGTLRFVSITAGDEHTCAIAVDSLAYCWGSNSRGQLGINERHGRLAPTPVAYHRHWSLLSGGARHTCGITAGDHPAAYCWGDNFHGQTAERDFGTHWAPTLVTTRYGLIGLTAGRWHTCFVWKNAAASVTCVGADYDGQLGQNVFASYVQASAGDAHTCAVRNDGAIYCWGRNAAGQLGDGTHFSELRPVRIAKPAAPGAE
jgi:alpha-tubulin suppressor-like RCC1 family protein